MKPPTWEVTFATSGRHQMCIVKIKINAWTGAAAEQIADGRYAHKNWKRLGSAIHIAGSYENLSQENQNETRSG